MKTESEHTKLSAVEGVMSDTKDKMQEIQTDQGAAELGPLAVVVAKTIASHAAAISVIAEMMQQPGARDRLEVVKITDALDKSQKELQAALDKVRAGIK